MSRRLLNLEIRGRLLAADLTARLVDRARSERGQTTVEWVAATIALMVLIAAVWGGDVWHDARDLVVNAVNAIFSTDGDRV